MGDPQSGYAPPLPTVGPRVRAGDKSPADAMVLLAQVRSTPAEMAAKRTSWMTGSGPTHAPLAGSMVYTGY
jgi:hypothetical protein